jgi:peroxiredoxin/uncharacterized membrane protein YphA (DoxX/SURF4 family)
MMGHGPVEGVLVAARLLLAATFGLAAAAKLLDRSLAGGELESLGLPGPIARVARPAVPAAEIVTALLLALPVPGRWGGIAALVLLTVFTGFVAIQLIRGRTPDCRCFGQLSARPIGRATVARNLALAGVAALLLALEPAAGGPMIVPAGDGPMPVGRAAPAAPGVTLVAVVVLGLIVVSHRRQLQDLRQRLERLEHVLKTGLSITPPPAGLAIGARAPEFELGAPDGRTCTLSELRRAGHPVVLIFSDPSCKVCGPLLPWVAHWQREHDGRLTIALITRGDPAKNATTAEAHRIRHFLTQRDREAADAYRVVSVPAAVAVGADGRIASEVAVGAPAVRDLIVRFVGETPAAG